MLIVCDESSRLRWCVGQWIRSGGVSENGPSDLPESLDDWWPIWESVGGGRAPYVDQAEGDTWTQVHIVGRVAYSQFDAVVDLLRASDRRLPSSFACFAVEGEQFHGNRQRPWQAHAGNIHLSCFRSLNLSAHHAPSLSMIPTLAVCDVGEFFGGGATRLEPRIKWVNDVYVGRRKLSGSLTHTVVQDGRILGVVYGIGMNVEVTPKVTPDGNVTTATSLVAELGERADVGVVAMELLRRLSGRIDQLECGGGLRIYEDYCRRSNCLGKWVSIFAEPGRESGNNKVIASGELLRIRSDLSLDISGVAEPITSGRMVLSDSSS